MVDWTGAFRYTLLGTACAIIVSVLVNYLLFFGDALSPFSRSLVAAFCIPVVVGAPLSFLLFLAQTKRKQAERELTRLASTDRVTGCLNGSTFAAFVEKRVKSTLADNCVFIAVDIEHLKALTMDYGPASGEEAQKLIAATIQSSVRAGDLVGRIGDGQFGILLQNVTEAEATGICRRIREKVSDVYFVPDDKKLALDVRVAGINIDRTTSFDALFRLAHQEIYVTAQGQPLLPLSRARTH